MFIRVKKVKKSSGKIYEYAHLVRGIWRKRRLFFEEGGNRRFRKYNNSVHRYYKFLGRVYKFGYTKDINYDDFFDDFQDFVSKNKVDDIYKKLIEYELLARGFKLNRGVFIMNNVHVDLKRLIVHDGSNDVVAKLGNFSGYLCSITLDDLFSVKKISNRHEGIYLMKKLKAIGIKLNHDQFFILADKLLKERTED